MAGNSKLNYDKYSGDFSISQNMINSKINILQKEDEEHIQEER